LSHAVATGPLGIRPLGCAHGVAEGASGDWQRQGCIDDQVRPQEVQCKTFAITASDGDGGSEVMSGASRSGFSAEVSHAATEPAVLTSRCFLSDAHVLVPMVEMARLGRVTAAGPNGARACSVHPQGSQERTLVEITTKCGKIVVTATHRLPVRRGQSWTPEEASCIREGDIVRTASATANGEEVVMKVQRCTRCENAFELDVWEDGEIFTVSSNSVARGHMFGPSVAVLGVGTKNTEIREESAPPRLKDLPSEGSRYHPVDGARCGAICKQFQWKGFCREGRYCSFCHLHHPDASKRAPRGRRSERQ